MTKLELVINEVILKIKYPLPSNRRGCKWRTNHIFHIIFSFWCIFSFWIYISACVFYKT